MNIYELIRETNNKMITGVNFTDGEKQKIADELLLNVSDSDTVRRFHKGVNAPEKSADKHNNMYPMYYITPYNDGKKLRLITGELPKTHILSANHYELEILRILALFAGNNPAVKTMIDATINRLAQTCYAHWCPAGECVGAGISVLRFLSAIRPQKEEWIEPILTPVFNSDNKDNKIDLPVFYMYSAISDIANELCREFIESKKDWIIHMLTRGSLTGPAVLDTYSVTRLYSLRNALAILPEYEYLKGREVYIAGKDNRCYVDVSEAQITL